MISYSLCSIKMSIILIILRFKLLLHLFQVVLESIIRIIAIIVLLYRLFYLCHSHYLCRFFVDLIFFSPFHLIHYGYYWSIFFFWFLLFACKCIRIIPRRRARPGSESEDSSLSPKRMRAARPDGHRPWPPGDVGSEWRRHRPWRRFRVGLAP